MEPGYPSLFRLKARAAVAYRFPRVPPTVKTLVGGFPIRNSQPAEGSVRRGHVAS